MNLSPFVVVALLCIGYRTSLTGASQYVKVGCFRDSPSPRALPELIANYRSQIPWNNLDQVVTNCALEALKRNYMYFGIQFYGECWSGVKAPLTYDRYGPSSECVSNVGGRWSNLVYRFIGDERECLDYSSLNSANRSSSFHLPLGLQPSCDNSLSLQWYRFVPPAGYQIASTCVQSGKCGTVVTGWLNSAHPKVTDRIVNGKVCFRWGSNCCQWSQDILVRNCGRFYVYKLDHTVGCPMRFCGQ